MKVTCKICKHYSRTMEEHGRHIQSEAHKTNAEIYEMGLAAGKFESAATIARLRGFLEAYLYVFDDENISDERMKKWLDGIWIPDARRELSRSGSESEEK